MIIITQGDTAVLELTAENGDGDPVDITGATFTTYIKGPNGVVASFPNDQHEIIDAEAGRFNVELGSDDTEACGLGSNKEILTKIVQGSSTIYYRGIGVLQVNPPVPVQ